MDSRFLFTLFYLLGCCYFLCCHCFGGVFLFILFLVCVCVCVCVCGFFYLFWLLLFCLFVFKLGCIYFLFIKD